MNVNSQKAVDKRLLPGLELRHALEKVDTGDA